MVVKLRSHFARNGVSYAALFVALGGTAFAAQAGTGGRADHRLGSPPEGVASQAGPVAVDAWGRRKVDDFTRNGNDDLLERRLNAGSYVILAKVTADPEPGSDYRCILVAGSNRDEAVIDGSDSGNETVTMMVLHESGFQFRARLQCPDGSQNVERDIWDLRLIAIRVHSINPPQS
jgi:hypothetical protein